MVTHLWTWSSKSLMYIYVVDLNKALFSSIYIYIYSHPQTDCFVVSQLFFVARLEGRLKHSLSYLCDVICVQKRKILP